MATYSQNVSGVVLVGPIVLTANLTDIILSDAADGQLVTIEFVQDGTGSRTVASLATVLGLAQPTAAANSESFQRFIYNQALGAFQPLSVAEGNPLSGGITAITTTAQALSASVSSYVTLGGSGVDACTLAAPAADGLILTAVVITAHAHTITTPANKIAGGFDTITFGTTLGNMVTLESAGGLWYVTAAQGVTLTEV